MIIEIIFWLSLLALLHTYVLYPLLLRILSGNRNENQFVFACNDPLPFVSIIMAVHNEEEVIADKIRSIYYTRYPLGNFEVLVGSDCSTDGTNRILSVFSNNYKHFHFSDIKKRKGKPAIINLLAAKAKGEILIITDANVFLETTSIFEIVKHFRNPRIGLVDTRTVHRGTVGEGISVQEHMYITREANIKYMESVLWGTMMGPFGGCFAIRKALFKPVPDRFLVDDFFINLTVLSMGFQAINSTSAYVTEDLSISLKEEFRRKIRIATGNFQNLASFFRLLWPQNPVLSFYFFSHKVLRWLGPFFVILTLLSSIFLSSRFFYKWALIIQIGIFIIPLVDFLFRKLKVNIVILRFVTHFLSMNLALLIGFIKYATGVKSNVWQPTRRNQSE